jgi:hypothetical protein
MDPGARLRANLDQKLETTCPSSISPDVPLPLAYERRSLFRKPLCHGVEMYQQYATRTQVYELQLPSEPPVCTYRDSLIVHPVALILCYWRVC